MSIYGGENKKPTSGLVE